MAQNHVISNHRGGREEVWRCLMISTILVSCIIPCEAVSEEKGGQLGTDSETIPRGCQHIVSGVEENDQGSNTSLQTQLKPYTKGGRRVGVSASYLGLQPISLEFTAQQGPFSALNGPDGYRILSFSPSRSLRTANNDVYLVRGQLAFVIDEGHQSLSMAIDFDGVFSNRTGTFCSTGCAGEPDFANVDHEHTTKGQPLNNLGLTPAKLEYLVKHPQSESVSDTLVGRDCEIHVELKFPRAITIETPLVTGVMTSLRSPDVPSYFNPLNLWGWSKAPYQYDRSVENEAEILGRIAMPDISNGVRKELNVWSADLSLCAISRRYQRMSSRYQRSFSTFQIDLYRPIWNSSCLSREGRRCSPFHNPNIMSRIVSSAMRIRNMECSSSWKLGSATFEFDFTSKFANKTSTTSFLLFAEGLWANLNNQGQLVMVAHYLARDGTPLDTQIEITLQVPMVQTIHHRYGIVGHVRSAREASDALYFPSFSFVGDMHGGSYIDDSQPETVDETESNSWVAVHRSYIYDSTIQPKMQHVCNLAANTHKKSHTKETFPDGSLASDLEFSFSLDIPKLGTSQPHLYLENRFIDQVFNDPQVSYLKTDKQSTDATPVDRLIPVSFQVVFQEDLLVAMEGYYNSTSGHLCMLGCRRRWEDVAAPYQDDNIWNRNASQIESCDLVFSIQYPPVNPENFEKGPYVRGTITSLLDAGHPLYFMPVDFKSSWTTMYSLNSARTVLRRNAETIMTLATLSIATFLIAVQVAYSSRESSFKNVRYLSVVMLTILTSGHMLSLLLSFNAFWTKSVPLYRGNSYSNYSGWPEAQEVIVRGTSMVAFLLELRLLQLVWKSRTSAQSNPQFSTVESPRKVSDVAVLLTCLPIYATMAIVVGFVHWQTGAHPHRRNANNYSYLDGQRTWDFLWADFQAFSGVIVDLFLLPQVIANVLWDTEEKVAPLHSLFYIGMTAVRSAQHLFDVYRASNFSKEIDTYSYFYANPNWDLYSTEWDFIISGFSVVLATLLLLQQKYGGRWFIPTRSRR